MNESLAVPLIAAVLAAVGVLTAAFLTHRWTLRREDRSDRRAVEREAAASLCERLYSLQKLVVRSEIHPVPSQEIFEAVALWETTYRRHETLLPSSWRHVRRSVASALGEHFGAIGTSNLFSVPEDYPVAAHDTVWWDNACDYLQYLHHQLSRWGHKPMDAHKIKIHDFDTWLSQRR
ncbi:hypothetical protein ABC337_03590 [Arthrobacter sp. 1P04PC]|uniref:hypothetical protein n=1 Tax=unclassified Arthrobacter TaxID=235627 RepID=UPI0039A0F72E